MSLTQALNIAQSALFNRSHQTSILSRNISEVSNPDYARRTAVLSSMVPGVNITSIRRATSDALFRQNLAAISAWQGQSALSQGLNTLQVQVNGVDNAFSPASAIGNLHIALQTYAAAPSNRNLAENAVEAARQVVRSLNNGTAAIQALRADTDKEIARAVSELNRFLAEFEVANKEIVAGTVSGRDVSDALDRRDALIKQISLYLPVSTIARANNDMVLTTAGGVTLFETVVRPVSFSANDLYTAEATGNAIYVDGVPLAAGSGGNTTASGSLAAHLQLRDHVAVRMQQQLDEIASRLIITFREKDPLGTLADATGLFTWQEGPDLPPPDKLVDGLAGSIRINAAMDSSVGGNPELLRDGGANGASYVHNSEGASYATLLNSLLAEFDEPEAFDPDVSPGGARSLLSFSGDAISWLEALRKDAASGAEAKEALANHTATALSNETGVNLDEEMALLLELEQSYEASARLLAVIDEMLATLLEATR
ncbi:flagellar hook-associated protein FlgK [Chelativorans sp. Marseille-P2723]|uniref:flagellar hook-associated protein FlgK n=1 Tax=Chelativorans sp. Marseille-P2723 TaxID=2709133 RepID=UPI00156E3902|nr:flagellar hook-associated protein FlgK [Chelativorans sp. Marseille-P2723]